MLICNFRPHIPKVWWGKYSFQIVWGVYSQMQTKKERKIEFEIFGSCPPNHGIAHLY